MRTAVVDWILIASILGAFIGGFFTPDETKKEVIKYITLEQNTTKEKVYPPIYTGAN